LPRSYYTQRTRRRRRREEKKGRVNGGVREGTKGNDDDG